MKWTLPALLLLALSCAPPETDYDVSQIEAIGDMDTLMHVQATVADPRFELAGDLGAGELSAENRAEFEDMALRLRACAVKLKSFSDGDEGFARFADKQALLADQLGEAASFGDTAATVNVVTNIKNNCADCHDGYR